MAQDYLGVFYATGQGVTKNYAEAAKWFRKAAERLISLSRVRARARKGSGSRSMLVVP